MRKSVYHIGLLFLLSLAACGLSPKVEPFATFSSPLSAIDSLMWQRPDSALMRLLPYFDTCRDVSRNVSENGNNNLSEDVSGNVSTATEYDLHYANLLLTELLYKNDYTQTNRAELLQAMCYFDSLMLTDLSLRKPNHRDASNRSTPTPQAIDFLAARAHYINGVGYYEDDSVVQACAEYLKALEVMGGHFEERELVNGEARFIALTYTHLTELYSDMYLHEQAKYFGKLSLEYYQKYDAEAWHVAWILNNIGSHYDMVDELDSAEYYYQRAEMVLYDTNTLIYRDIASHQAYLGYKKEPRQVNASVSRLFHLLSKSESIEENIARSLFIGGIHYHEKQFDSAWHYLSKVYRETSNIGAKKQAAEWLMDICNVLDKNTDAFEYANFLALFANQEENNSGLKSQLTELYTAFKQKKLEQQRHLESKKYAKLALLVFGGMFVVMLAAVLFCHENRRSKQKLETQLKAEHHAHKMQQAALAGRLRQSNVALKEQNGTASSFSPLASVQNQNGKENYVDEPVCQQILSICNDKSNPIKSTVPVSAYKNIVLNDSQKAKLIEAATKHYGPLFEKMKIQHPEMKEKDFMYCYLCLLGLNNAQIAVLLQNSISTIWERENRLKRLFGSKNKIAVILFGLMNE